jgi:hypothetical protein
VTVSPSTSQRSGSNERASGHAVALAALLDPLDPEPVVLVRPLDRRSGRFAHRCGRARMIHVTMGDPDFLQRQSLLL